MVALREDPAVAAGHDPELDPRGSVVRRPAEIVPGDVPLERDAAEDPLPEAGSFGHDAVRTVRSDDVRRAHAPVADPGRRAVLLHRELRHSGGVPYIDPRGRRLLDEERVEPAPLGHEDERGIAPLPDAQAVAGTQLEAVDDVLDDRGDVARCVLERAAGEPAAARLVAREARLVCEQHTGSAVGQSQGGRGAGRAGADDEDVEMLQVLDRKPSGAAADAPRVKLLAAVCLACLALFAAACGGDGSSAAADTEFGDYPADTSLDERGVVEAYVDSLDARDGARFCSVVAPWISGRFDIAGTEPGDESLSKPSRCPQIVPFLIDFPWDVELAGKYRLPAIYFQKEFVDEGGLMSYGVDYVDLFRRAAVYVDKILKGAKPADLPVQQATKFEFVINLKAAKQIGLTTSARVSRAGEQSNQVRRGECQVSSDEWREQRKDMNRKITVLTLCAHALRALLVRHGAAAEESPADRISIDGSPS